MLAKVLAIVIVTAIISIIYGIIKSAKKRKNKAFIKSNKSNAFDNIKKDTNCFGNDCEKKIF
ncbi:MAG: hypothetical protein JXR58_04550, partial [Bacteroidales bacterium]|nr:hypothetical protein [Bacteroidales bacterium]